MAAEREIFGEMPDGHSVERVRLTGGGLTAHVMTYGAVLQDLRIEGHDAPLVLGFDHFAPYLTHSPYFGAMAGRCANRIAGGEFEIDGVTFPLEKNFLGKHTLHGGSEGMGRSLWTIEALSDDQVTLSITQADGHMGFPGRLDVRVTYGLCPGGVFDIQIEAESDAPTLCNIAHHSYFNLGSALISDHLFQVDAETYVVLDEELIPTGEVASVEGTKLDFRTARELGPCYPLDNNLCVAEGRGPLKRVARLAHPTNGLALEVRTTEPGLQIYDAGTVDIDLPGLHGAPMGPSSGFALEPQIWPDAVHHPHFPQAVLRPGETYRQQSQFVFSRGAGEG